MALNMSGFNSTFEPPTMDMSASPVLRLWTAWCSATRVVEQPVSSVMLAPRRSKKCEMRFDAMAEPVPVGKNLGRLSSSRIMPSL